MITISKACVLVALAPIGAAAAALTITSKPILSSTVNAAVVDKSGNVYLTGITYTGLIYGINRFPVTRAAFQSQSKCISLNPSVLPCAQAFVVKLSPSGEIVYASYLGGTSHDVGLAIAVDNAGNAYVAGATYSTDFPVSAMRSKK